VFLQVIDKNWRDHLYELDRLKEGIGLRAYGQKNPLLEYKSEAFDMFMSVVETIQEESVSLLFRAQVGPAPERPPARVPEGQALHPDARRAADAGGGPPVSASTPPEFGAPTPTAGGARESRGDEGRPATVRKGKKVGRNDPCPCGSGKKYKKCCGKGH
jgi:preprotein translocase subunit SecA